MPYNYNCSNNSRFAPGGALLPFIAGVAVTTPFIFLAKNEQKQSNNYPPQQIYYQQPPIYYQAPGPVYPYQYSFSATPYR